MYCSGCGTTLEATLNFCNRCGNRVPKGEAASVASNLSQSAGYVGGFGLLGFIFVTAVMLRKGVPMEALVPISFFYFATLFGICWLLIRYSTQLSRMENASKSRQVDPHAASYLGPRTTAQLEEAREAPASVVDHTTRMLEKVPAERPGQI